MLLKYMSDIGKINTETTLVFELACYEISSHFT
jgi:hypothetical protein